MNTATEADVISLAGIKLANLYKGKTVHKLSM